MTGGTRAHAKIQAIFDDCASNAPSVESPVGSTGATSISALPKITFAILMGL